MTRLFVIAAASWLVACGGDDDGGAPDASSSTRDSGAAPGTDAAGVDGGGGGGRDAGGGGGMTLADRYPGDVGLADDPAVLFLDDFEAGWGRWDAPTADTQYLFVETDAAIAHAGERYLRSTVTEAHLEAETNVSASPRVELARRVETMYWRLHVRFPVVAPNPHHWIRVEAGTEAWSGSGRANMVPPGDEGFWFDTDIDDDDAFNFYVYWHEMRSGRCNDGSATPMCEGDQGTTYYYGNVFRPADQTPFARDEWLCLEIGAGASTPGTNDGWLEMWVDDVLVGRYAPGEPTGTWLRATFHEGGCDFSACTEPVPFEGFDFRTSDDVLFKRIYLDAYYQLDTYERKRMELESRGLAVSDEQTIYYDDIVVATERIGCRR